MKFLCVPCDKPMKLEATTSERGSISLRYACADCGYEFAMLTNPMETQVVGSLGVGIGPEGQSKCPVTGIAREMAEEQGAPAPGWTSEAEARMAKVPEFVKPMVRTGIERFARDRGYANIDTKVLEEARGFFDMD